MPAVEPDGGLDPRDISGLAPSAGSWAGVCPSCGAGLLHESTNWLVSGMGLLACVHSGLARCNWASGTRFRSTLGLWELPSKPREVWWPQPEPKADSLYH